MIEVRQGPKQNDLQLGTNTTSEMGSTEEHLPPACNALVRNAEDNKKPEARKQTKETAYCFLRRSQIDDRRQRARASRSDEEANEVFLDVYVEQVRVRLRMRRAVSA